MAQAVVLLHGFGGTGRSWDPVVERLDAARYRPLAPDLRGHGRRGAVRPITWEACVGDVLNDLGAGATLVGYSQGGRLALHAALAAPTRVQRLVLIATTAGIDDDAAREQRRAQDEELAERLQAQHPADWIADWQAQPVFAGTPSSVRTAWAQDLARSRPADLAVALRGIGTGTMAPLWGRLGELTMPTDVVVGGRDVKFSALGRRLAAGLPDARLHTVDGAGHGLVREAPARLAALI